jgi:hypothetical protein
LIAHHSALTDSIPWGIDGFSTGPSLRCTDSRQIFDVLFVQAAAANSISERNRHGRLSYNNCEVDDSGDAPDRMLDAVRFELAWDF